MKGLHTADATLPALKRMAQDAGVHRVILMATYFPLKGTGVFNKDMLQRCGDDPFWRMCASIDLTKDVSAGLDDLHWHLRQKQVVGIKLYPGYQNFHLAGPEAVSVYSVAKAYGVPVQVHMGALHHCCGFKYGTETRCGRNFCPLDGQQHLSHPNCLASALELFPEVPFIACHLGYPYMKELKALMDKHLNLYTDTGGIIRSGDPLDDTELERQQMANELTDIINGVPDGRWRVMMATDFPIQSYASTMDILDRMHLTAHERQLLTNDNAMAVFGPNLGD
jgi:predicted TIM-barrel fold metal-dependent hydrolase